MSAEKNPEPLSPRPGTGLAGDLGRLLGRDAVFTEGPAFEQALADGTAFQGIRGRADALVLPGSADRIAAVMRFCHDHDIPMTVRGGGTGLAAGAVPDGGVVIGLERLSRIRSLTPERWQMEVEAGVRTGQVHRTALENGLLFPPDPGAAEQSMIGGNIATNAGGPHAYRHGSTGAWVNALEAVVAPGEVIRTGAPLRKDVAGLDLTGLMVGSEGTLGIVTSAWLRLIPAPEARGVVVGFYPDAASGCEAVARITASGIEATALEFLDRGALDAAAGSFPLPVPPEPGFALLAEADGHPDEVRRLTAGLAEAMTEGATGPVLPVTDRAEIDPVWRWRSGVSFAVAAARGGKLSDDVVVPGERLAEAIDAVLAIGARHDLPACSWGHAGDGNLHATFMVDLDDADELERAETAIGEVLDMAIRLGGSITGEHGIGRLKLDHVTAALDAPGLRLERELKRAFDPRNLLNPGRKIP